MHPLRSFLSPLLMLAATGTCVLAADAPQPWPADAFLPVTAERIDALPASAQPVWRAYWEKSTASAKQLSSRDLVDHSSNVPLPGGPIGSSYSKGVKLGAPAAWYATEEARVVADHVVNWQTPVGGWVKSGDYSRDRKPADDHHDAWSAGTFDNDSTIYELRFLALVNAAAPDSPRSQAWRECFRRGVDYTLAAQYPNGGFPQIYPLVGWYHDAITFNDDAMVHILELLRDIGARQAEFAFVPADRATVATERLALGIRCVLDAQLRDADGGRSIWAQQVDPLTLRPCAARNFEPISACSLESAGLVQFLMTVPHPSRDIVTAINGAMTWFPAHVIRGVVWDRDATAGSGLVPREHTPDLWARFSEIGTGKPVFGERDRTVHYDVTELSLERRKGYGWFNSRPAALPALYTAWKKQQPGAN